MTSKEALHIEKKKFVSLIRESLIIYGVDPPIADLVYDPLIEKEIKRYEHSIDNYDWCNDNQVELKLEYKKTEDAMKAVRNVARKQSIISESKIRSLKTTVYRLEYFPKKILPRKV